MGLSLERFNVVIVERIQHTNGSQKLRYKVLVAIADAINVHGRDRERDFTRVYVYMCV